jgi:hypothetical protein
MAKARRRPPRKAKKLREAAAPRPELNAASRAQPGS